MRSPMCRSTRLLTLALLLFLTPALWSYPRGRMLLALYNSSENPSLRADNNTIHQLAEMPLNWLGFYLHYHDIAQGVPPDDLTDQAHGIVTWFWTDEMAHPTQYLDWLQRQLNKEKKVVILGNVGAFVDSETKGVVPNAQINAVLNAMGLQWEGNWTAQSENISISSISKEMMNFEAQLNSKDLHYYEQVRSTGAQNKVYLTLNRTDLSNGKSDVVVTTPNGGFILSDYGVEFDNKTGEHRWYLNPFLFFARALDVDGWPRLDTTTLFGRRLFFAHVDGNGFFDKSEIADNTTAAQVTLQQVVRKYPLPVTVSFVS